MNLSVLLTFVLRNLLLQTSQVFRRIIKRMKVDIHNHILPKEWPDLKQVGTMKYIFMKDLRRKDLCDSLVP